MDKTELFSRLQRRELTTDLLRRLRESEVVEFKRRWLNKRQSSRHGPYWQIVKTISAFANDFHGNGGGVIVIGKDEKEEWPSCIVNIPSEDLDKLRREIRGACLANIKPSYVPEIVEEVVEVESKDSKESRNVLVITACKSDNRPHQCREMDGEYNFYIREGTETTKVSDEEKLRRLLLCLYNRFPFDDTPRTHDSQGQMLSETSIDFGLVKKYLEDVGSKLLETCTDPIEVYIKLDLVKRIGRKYVPKNFALLLFNTQPHIFFAGARTDIRVCTHDTRGGDPPKTHSISGPIDQQTEEVVSFILKNTPNGAYPEQAVREVVTNAFLHRGYEECYNNPVEIEITPNFIEVYSYPGPDPSLTEELFTEGNKLLPVQCRNTKILEVFKKRKLAEGWNTGVATSIKAMKENNNPAPTFTFTPGCFRVHLSCATNCSVHLNVLSKDANGKDDDKSDDGNGDFDDDDDHENDGDNYGGDNNYDADGDNYGGDNNDDADGNYRSFGAESADDVGNEEMHEIAGNTVMLLPNPQEWQLNLETTRPWLPDERFTITTMFAFEFITEEL